MSADRRALIVTTAAGAAAQVSGATIRATEVIAAVSASGYAVERVQLAEVDRWSAHVDLLVAVSYACADTVRVLRGRAERVWLDAVDSWLLVNGSAMRHGRPSYLLRTVRDATRLARMPQVGLVTYISAADRQSDRRTVRADQRLVLPPQVPAQLKALRAAGDRRVVLTGDWRYPPNRDGLRWFLRKVLPRVHEQAAFDWEVAVYGPGWAESPPPRVVVHGYVDAETGLYRRGDVHVAPVRFGGGVKRKVVQPLVAGLPVVTTPAGAHGLRAHSLLDVHRDAAGFSSAIARRLTEHPVVAPACLSDLLDADDSASVGAWLRA